MTECPTRQFWQAVLEQRLPAADEAAMSLHAEACSTCQNVLETLTQAPALSLVRRTRGSRSSDTLRRSAPTSWFASSGVSPFASLGLSLPHTDHLPVLPGYELLEELGRGGMGVVFKARHLELNRIVALKMLREGALADADLLTRFRDEARVVARLQHPGIVQIHEVGTLEGRPYLALEYVAGPSLDRVLHNSPLPPRDAAALLIPLAEALAAAHQQGVLHRDLKPANVLLSVSRAPQARAESPEARACGARLNDWIPKITDFGLAKPLDDDSSRTATGMVVGTPSYMAPEQAAGERKLGPTLDVYALGTILYECLTGRPPFKGVTAHDTVYQVLTEEPVPPHRLQLNIPRDLETICLKCLHKEPAKRYATAQALADDLRRFLEGRPIQARPVSRMERMWRWCRRNPVVAGLTAAMVLVLLTSSVTGWLLAAWALQAEETARQAADRAAHQEEQAKRERDIAQRERQRADANLARARESVDETFLLCRTHELFEGDGMLPVRRLLLSKALPFYRDFVREASDDPAIMAGQADLLVRLGHIYSEIGPKEAAVPAYKDALALYERLAARKPGAPTFKPTLAEVHQCLGIALLGVGQHADAVTYFRQACQELEQLHAAQPTEVGHLQQLATGYANLGNTLEEQGQNQDALRQYHRALECAAKLLAIAPDYPGHQALQAATWMNLSSLYRKMGQPDEALTFALKAHQVWTRLQGAYPSHLHYENRLAGVWGQLAQLYYGAGRRDEGRAAYQHQKRLLEQLVVRQPNNLEFALLLGGTCCNLGNEENNLERPAAALPLFNEALKHLRSVLSRSPQEAKARLFLRNTYIGRTQTLAILQGRAAASWNDWQRAKALDDGSARDFLDRSMDRFRPLAQADHAWLLTLSSAMTARGSGPITLAGELGPWLLWTAPAPER